MSQQTRFLESEAHTKQFGAKLAKYICNPLTLTFKGQIGAGKTTLIRALLMGLGVKGTIKSPTFSIVEEYPFADFNVYHFDCYRIAHPEELEYIGFRDYFTNKSVCLIEWPELAGDVLPQVDLCFELKLQHNGRSVSVVSETSCGENLIKRLDW